ncbi:hypothetical protein [Aliarcobacter cibarius]|uniref:Lipoprotein n=1 Tax=Aliarcobacter cibarius TaxID=255507 RepID=A0A5J6REE6_9BACT|nr:hypothetical protein [Aliarcobacter cibarius]QEZ88406.1 hypothetical protein ACIB15232_0211 [Aliarcobacter cibarius]QKJ26416.1 hypothetical protein ACBT_0452 [Aliarcobacter cibarius]TLT01904.1 hypothetical protein FE247_00610 [Aliarcobacter cibarius]TLT02239.1 hypothetical protein FE245_00610 [Aliarcobacter cibarius]TLT04670.1 hypothetical protein FE248_03305 [Aliarcobacter cibarius]
MFKILKILPLIFVLNSCISSKNVSFNNNFSNLKKQNTYDYCSKFSYIANVEDIKYKKLFIEYINLDQNCKWNGLASGFFISLFKDNLKVKSFEYVEKYDFKNIEILTYIIDDIYYVDFINEFGVFDDKLIIDYSGIYTDEILRKNGKINNYKDYPRLDFNYDKSLVRFNFINNYFSRDSENFRN